MVDNGRAMKDPVGGMTVGVVGERENGRNGLWRTL